MDKVAIGARFRQARLKKGLTQEALAEKADSGTTYISDIERGARLPSLSLFVRLVGALDVSSDYILSGELNSGTRKLDDLTPQEREKVSVMIDAFIKTIKQ